MADGSRRSGVQSIEVGGAILRALTDAAGPVPLSAVARATGMSTAKVHRYLVSYVQTGLVAQNERSGSYDLGPLAVRMGLAAIERFDIVRVASDRLEALRDQVEQTVLLAVWTDAGPTVARIELSRHPVTLAVRIGTAFPLRTSATGRMFFAFAPELAASHDPAPDGPGRELAAEVRSAGYTSVEQTFLVGVSAIAVPVFHGTGRLAAALTVIGQPAELDTASR